MKIKLFFTLIFLPFGLIAQSLADKYEEVNDAVVVILTEQNELKSNGKVSQTVTSGGLGSGFMISDKQLITAAHVVQVAEKLNIQFLDGETIPAKVISSFSTADVALVELLWPKKDAVTVKLANSDQIRIGEPVFVVGAPFGLGHSLSSGFVSGIIKSKKNKNPFTNSEYIQTDAAINTGNSGGPMFNMNGEVIGVVSNILSQSGGFQGIGFAATSNITKELLFENKMLWSGTDLLPLVGKSANLFNVPQESGLLVQKVVKSSPFGIIGLNGGEVELIVNDEKIIAGGDIILSINGIQFEMNDETLYKISENLKSISSPNHIELKVLRAGKIITLGKR